MNLNVKWVSSLEKIFVDDQRSFEDVTHGSALRGEKYHMQLAVNAEGVVPDNELRIEIDSPLNDILTVYTVRSVPVLLPAGLSEDPDFLRKSPGLFPDVLEKFNGRLTIAPSQWRSMFFELDIPENFSAGLYSLKVSFYNVLSNELLAEKTVTLDIVDAVLPKQDLIYTCWFHNDSLCTYYDVPVFSDEHWKIAENYIANAAKYGVNMLLTPIFTPPLDTEIGKERLTVQLIGIKYRDGKYEFDFSNLSRYIKMALSNGIEYFEIAHLFTQWGAKAAPKIIVEEEGKEIVKFGWHTSGTSKEYMDFLYQFIPELKAFLSELSLLDKCYFHISDEPNMDYLENYTSVCNAIKPLLSDCNVIDALSDYEFYSLGLIKNPIPTNIFIEEFIEKGVEHRWTYYCCGELDKVSNRMIAMPSYRTRVLGLQLYKLKIEGFLQWGFNFWFNRLSRKLVNPYICTDCEDYFPAGDGFVVYPGVGGTPVPSLRELIFFDALQDMRALKLLEGLIGYEKTVELLEKDVEMPLTFKEYPRNNSYILNTRESVNMKIKECITK